MSTLLLATALLPASFAPAAENTATLTSLLSLAPSTLQYSVDSDASTHSDYYFQVGFQTVTTRSSDGPDEEIDFNEGWAVPILVGKRFSSDSNENLGFAIELEGIYSDQEADDDGALRAVRDVTGINVLLNGVVDYSFSESVGVYGGAGIGLGFLDIGTESDGISSFDDEDGPFLSWQLKAGMLFQASETIGIDLGYRFLNTDDAQLDDTNGNASFNLQTRQHMIGLGLRFDV
ncbi:hypothetical protein Poly30_46540 [Planctomycetes bacterium Poly30]|uniref:Outer membrane protein beta-barrel domain-containing protein n=1 Tax=Saltatorellus ferox TaxID=2528018 RepID=A0A518EYE1_9BACT|nr:hypothetical protein Poly30_46540 [Planctomycetes bacterium Poly30]